MAKTLDDFMGLTSRQQFVMAMYLFVPYQLETTDLQRLTAVTGTFDVSIKALNQDLSFLARHRWIEHADNYSMDYTAAGTYPAHTLRAILDIASKQGWLPDPKQLADAMESPLRHSYTTRNYKLIIRTAELIRLLLTGSGKGVTRELTDWLKGKKKLSLIRGAVFRLNSLISDDIDFRLSGSDDPLLPLMRFWLNIRFICGKDIRPLLQTLHDLKRTLKSDDDEELERMFASLCVWTGCGTWIPDAATLTGPVKDRLPFRTFIEGCRCVMEGNMAAADACFRKVETFDVKERNRPVDRWCYVDDGTFESRKFDNLPERLLVATVAAVAKPDKIAKGRPAEIMSDTELIDYGVYQYAERTENHYLAMIAHTARLFKEEWRPLVSGKDTFLLELKAFPLEKMDPVGNLLLAWNYRMLPANRSKYTDMAAKLYVFAKTLAGNGYLNLAWLMVCLLPGAYDPVAEADFLVPLKQHAVQFLPIIQLEPEWKAFLKHFGTAIGKAVKSQKRIATVPSVRWLWQIVIAAADNGCYRIDYLMGAVRREGDPEDGSRDQRFVSEYDLNKAATKGFMSERDLLIERTLRGRYGYGYHDFDKNTMRDLLGLFCGIDNLETVKRARPSREFVNAKPVRFIAKKCELETAVTADGGMRISLPEWVIHAESDRILRKIDESTYAVVEITKEAAKLIEILSTFDTGHKGIEIPAAGMGEALPLLEAAAEILPVAAPSEKERDKLPKVKGNTGTTVRLSFTEGTLSLRAVVKPLADNPSFVLDPGMGQAERMVSGVAGSYILTRDLAAEKAHFERVKETLAACESWFDGKCAWMIDDISVALSALMALKTSAAEPEAGFTPPVLEWIDDRRITVVNVPQSGVTLTASKTAEEWFRVNGTFTLDDGRVLSVVQMLEAMPTRTGEYVRLTDGAYARLTKAMARQLEALGAASRRKGDGVEVVKAAIP
ncbi:MAG: hypothetical protein J6U40_04665, partial [Kiritimatiellae bacterium]|nr:hypothetical protein [Kiritimatiellia bacterium]